MVPLLHHTPNEPDCSPFFGIELQNALQGGNMKGMFTATLASSEIGCSIATVTRWAKRLNLGDKYGSSLALTKDEVERIACEWKKQAGNPNFSKQKPPRKKTGKKAG